MQPEKPQAQVGDLANKSKLRSFLSNKYFLIIAIVVVAGIAGRAVFAGTQTTAVPGGIYLSIDDIGKLPMSGPAWDNVKKAADANPGVADIADQTSDHDIHTYAAALVYARTGNDAYRVKAANQIMAAVNTEKGGRALALSWNLSAYVISADLINLPQYDSVKGQTFRNWLSAVRTEDVSGKTLISTHEDRPNNWGVSAGASRAAADVYLGDKADLAKTANVFKGWTGDRAAYAGFSWGDLSWQCDPTKPVGINPTPCTRNGINVGGAMPDDMRRGSPLKDPPAATDYPWTAMQGIAMQASILSRQGYDAFGWQNQAVKRAVQYLYDISKKDGSGWWANADEAWVPWVINSAYGSNYPTTSTPETGRVSNFADWTHSKPVGNPTNPPADKSAPTTPSSLKAVSMTANNVQLSWGPSTDNVTVSSYQISRDGAVLSYSATNAYTDKTAVAGKTYVYQVKAFDPSNNASAAASTTVTVAAATNDTIAPSATITSPTANATITAATFPVTFNSSDNVGVTKVEFYVDTQLESTETAINGKKTFSMNWNTKAEGNGKHTLQIKSYDANGNVGKSATVDVTIALATTPVPPTPTGTTLTFVASADARVSEANKDKNYGTEDFLRVRNDSDDWHTFLKFDVTGLSGTPKAVKLRVFANDGGPDAGTLFFTSNNWTETGVNWNNAPAFSNFLLMGKSITGSVNDQSYAEFDLTNKVVNKNGTYSFGIRSDDSNSIYFSSREGAKKPTLVVIQ